MRIKQSILIVCEGQRSEPDYFQKLKQQVLNNCDDEFTIKILPIPQEEKIAEDLENFNLRKGAKKRVIKTSSSPIETEQYIVEDHFKAQPICYVRKAQLEHLNNGELYDELWAVYDKDGHPKQEEAFSLSEDTLQCSKNVNIAFSSISFEVWILMHFEKTTQNYLKSQCKDRKKSIDCGNKINNSDCLGERCVCGHIVMSKYLEYDQRKYFRFEDYDPHWATALLNSALCREENKNELEDFYELNPYTTIDKLVLKLKYLNQRNLLWSNSNMISLEKDIVIEVIKQDNNLNFTIRNNSKRTFILNKEQIFLMSHELNKVKGNSRIVVEAETVIKFDIDISHLNFTYIVFCQNESEGLIIDKSSL